MRCCAYLCALVLLAPALAAGQIAPAAGRIKVATGTALIVRGGQPRAALPGATIVEGDILRTGADGRLSAMLSPAEIQRIFGEALSALPPPARRYLLYFVSGSDTLTPEARALVADILTTVQGRTRPDVSIIGHTDSAGAAPANVALGPRRAELVRDLLLAAGLDGELVEIASHGETNPVVATPDNTAEAKNRRVEVTVR